MRRVLITICARGGSKGIPRKNIKLLAGKPLISYSIEHASRFMEWLEKSDELEAVMELSTDDSDIKKVAANYGLETTYSRPDYLAGDTAGKLDAIKHLLISTETHEGQEFDYILDLDVSAPMRTIDDLKEAFSVFSSNQEASNLFSVSKANKNPYFNMVEKDEYGFWGLCKQLKDGIVKSRQTAPEVYEMNASFYFYRRSFFNEQPLSLFKKALIYNMSHESFDLDHELEFDFLNFLISTNKLSFTL